MGFKLLLARRVLLDFTADVACNSVMGFSLLLALIKALLNLLGLGGHKGKPSRYYSILSVPRVLVKYFESILQTKQKPQLSIGVLFSS